MSDAQLSFRKSANIERVTDKRKDSLFRLVDTDGSGTIDAQEFAVLYDAIKKDLADELEKEAALTREASSAKRRFKMLLLFVAVLVSFLAASVAANFAVMFTVVDQAITTTTTTTGTMLDKHSDTIVKTAVATQDVPFIVAPALDLDTLRQVKSLSVSYRERHPVSRGVIGTVEASMAVVGVRKHNSTFVEFITDVPGETVEALNGVASVVRYPTPSNGLMKPLKFEICSANATCSAFQAGGIDVEAALDLASEHLIQAGLMEEGRHLQSYVATGCGGGWETIDVCGWSLARQWVYWWNVPGGGFIDTCESLGLSSSNYVDDIMYMYYVGLSPTTTRRVVFFAHGKGGDANSLHMVLCNFGAYTCPDLTTPTEFHHLLFLFMGSDKTDQGSSDFANMVGWSDDVLDASTYANAAASVAAVMCKKAQYVVGADAGAIFSSCNVGNGLLAGVIGDSSKIMIVGYSDGAGLATYMNWKWSWKVTKAVAIDYWAFFNYNNWLTQGYVGGSGTPDIDLKIYTSCASDIYTAAEGSMAIMRESLGMYGSFKPTCPHMTIPWGAGLGWWPTWSGHVNEVGTASGSKQYMEYKWTFPNPKCPKYLKFAVEGLHDGTPTQGPLGASTMGAYWTAPAKCSTQHAAGANVHFDMQGWAPIVPDITEWVSYAGSQRRQLLFRGTMDPCMYAMKEQAQRRNSPNRRLEESLTQRRELSKGSKELPDGSDAPEGFEDIKKALGGKPKSAPEGASYEDFAEKAGPVLLATARTTKLKASEYMLLASCKGPNGHGGETPLPPGERDPCPRE